jgi:plastocyanin
MKKFNFIIFISLFSIISCTKDKAEQIIPTTTFHEVEALSGQFDPASLTINIGDTVRWTNTSGFHNVNATTVTFPNNPESFGRSVDANWTFLHDFTIAGTYEYQCDAHYSMAMTGVIVVQ